MDDGSRRLVYAIPVRGAGDMPVSHGGEDTP
jgi:hypothetical protein